MKDAMLHDNIERYIAELREGLRALDQQAIWEVANELISAWRQRRQIFVMGNGGSAAFASHMVNDLNKIVVSGQPRFKAIALTDNVALLTAWANDSSYDDVFSEQLRNLCQPGDLVLVTSCSGNSRNILKGLEAARTLGARTIAFTGDIGGQVKGMVDHCVYAPVKLIGQQEDIHLVLNHAITNAIARWISSYTRVDKEPLRAVVLAAGEGSRLRPLTLTQPKPMLPINGQPLLYYTLAWLRQHGIEDVAINLHHRPDAIVNHFGTGSQMNLRITYSYEDRILGTAGAVRKLESFVCEQPLVVVYGDVLTNLDLTALIDAHMKYRAADPSVGATLSLYHVPNPTEVGLVGMDASGRVTRFVEKPRSEDVFTDLANAGVFILSPEVVRLIPPDTNFDFGHHLFPLLLEHEIPVYGWVVPAHTYVKDIGTPQKYSEAQLEWHNQFASIMA